MDLLIIAVEALNLCTLHTQYNNNCNLVLFLTRSSNFLRHVNSNTETLLNTYLECIYLIYQAIQDPCLQRIANYIVLTYYNNSEEKSVRQYIGKYLYCYKKTQYYYNRRSCSDTLNINEIPIYNIYIISKAYKYNGNCLQYLIRYLCS
uniref:Uncharacterized protein n=1 Tax=Gelidium elegans TaxID=37200 RepID=A0A141SDP0_GELEL|nr:hypothetical protein Gele_165 [Gelidium elegans]AMK96408.1 hypothetical protein Gele_165 [Gelidium elegans]